MTGVQTCALPISGIDLRQEYKEDILVGYRWHDTKKIPALFPFGHGLSYTKFQYGKSTLSSKKMKDSEKIIVSVPVRNVGDREGKEIVQLYIGDEKCSVMRPVKELKKYEKISLNPGEEKIVEFEIDVNDLKFYDDIKEQWRAEAGKFKAYIGASSTRSEERRVGKEC